VRSREVDHHAVALTRPESARVVAGYTAVALIVGSVLLYRRDTGSRIQQLPHQAGTAS